MTTICDLEVMRSVVIDAWPPQPGFYTVEVYAEGVEVLGDDDQHYRVPYETMSHEQAVVFDAARKVALMSSMTAIPAVLPLRLDALSPSTAAMLLQALAEHAPAIQVLTWQTRPTPEGWMEI